MINNYLKIGFRNLVKRKGYTLLNMLGLTTGMICCLLIFHYVSYEKSYDSGISDADNIFRIRLDHYNDGKLSWKSATSFPGILPAMKKDFAEVEEYCRLIDANMLLANDAQNAKFNETKGYFAEQSFISMFDVKLISGNPAQALVGPNKMIVSEKMAKKYFGNENALGRRLTVKDAGIPRSFEISGVFREYPKNSHLIVEYAVSYDTFKKMQRDEGDTTNAAETSFDWYDFYSYLRLKPGTSIQKLEAKFPAFCDRYMKEPEESKMRFELSVIPVKDIHLYSNYNQEAETNGNGQMVSFLFLIAIFIICIAWVNYINLSTARSVERAKEVGMKKVLGAFRSDLIRQFLVENLILNALSLVISVIAFYLLLQGFDSFAGRDSFTGISLTSRYWKIFILLFLSGTFLSGIYPAFVISGFQPIKVLKGAFKNTSGGIVLRKGLVIMQFVITVVLIAGTLVVYKQVQYMRKQNLGVNIEQTLILNGPGSVIDSLYKTVSQPFKTELLQNHSIKNVCASSNVMGQEIYWTNGVRRLKGEKGTAVTLYNLGVDQDFIPSYAMTLKAGRNFLKDPKADKRTAILNEKAVALLGFENVSAAVNQKLLRHRDTLTVVGVVADYHHQGLQKIIDPMIILPRPDLRNYYSLKINSTDPAKTIADIKKIWDAYFPGDPFNYFFLDESYDQQYKTDILFGKVFSIFALMAIIIACLGLLGLSAYNVLQRHKEIGIRKVLGATVESILLLLSKDFLKLLFVAVLISMPLAWLVMNKWLQDFAYRIEINLWIFILAGASSLLIALLTISFQAIKAALENPVKDLRTE